ncbi:unnamed protein product, partial [Mesorhabditis spiculigera]
MLLLSLLAVYFQTIPSSAAVDDQGCSGCSAYQCIEKEASCGPRGYPIGFGWRNCRVFEDPVIRSRFTPAGVEWANCTAKCLIDALQQFITAEPGATCDRISSRAYSSHVGCYIQCGFCSICADNKWALARAYNYGDFFSFRALQQIWSIAKECGPFACFCKG